MEPSKDVQEVEGLLDNLRWLQKQMGPALANWRASRPNCNLAVAHMSKGILKEICEKPGLLNIKIFDPLIKWLSDYQLNREGRMAFTGKGLDTFLKQGLRHIHAFVVIAEFFEKNPQYFVPDPPIRDLAAYSKAQASQKQYRQFVNLLISKLIGCNRQLSFLFLDLSKTVSNLPKDLRDIQEYLEQQCLFTRTRMLGIK